MTDLYQDQLWVDREGRHHLIRDMDARYLTNVIDYLDRRALMIKYAELSAFIKTIPNDPSDGVSDFVDAALDEFELTPDEWLHGTPLYRALVAERDSRLSHKIRTKLREVLYRAERHPGRER